MTWDACESVPCTPLRRPLRKRSRSTCFQQACGCRNLKIFARRTMWAEICPSRMLKCSLLIKTPMEGEMVHEYPVVLNTFIYSPFLTEALELYSQIVLTPAPLKYRGSHTGWAWCPVDGRWPGFGAHDGSCPFTSVWKAFLALQTPSRRAFIALRFTLGTNY